MSCRPKHSVGSYAQWEADEIRKDRVNELAAQNHAAFMRNFGRYVGDLHEILYHLSQGEAERITDLMALLIEQAWTAPNSEERKQHDAELGALLRNFVDDEVWREALTSAECSVPVE